MMGLKHSKLAENKVFYKKSIIINDGYVVKEKRWNKGINVLFFRLSQKRHFY